MRINQYIAQSGYSSRRQAEKIIQSERVKINGKVASLKDFVTDNDCVMIDNKEIQAIKSYTYLVLHKPKGIITTMNPTIDKNVSSLLPKGIRLNPVGRLDKSTEGLLLFTNNNQLINHLLQGEQSVSKTYHIRVNKQITEVFIKQLSHGVQIYNPRIKAYQTTKAAKVSKLSNHELMIVLKEGLNRQIRRMCKQCGFTVTRLIRVGFGQLKLDGLNPSAYRYLTKEEIENIENTH